jgi:hypothetical protein
MYYLLIYLFIGRLMQWSNTKALCCIDSTLIPSLLGQCLTNLGYSRSRYTTTPGNNQMIYFNLTSVNLWCVLIAPFMYNACDDVAAVCLVWPYLVIFNPLCGFSRPQDSTRINHCYR